MEVVEEGQLRGAFRGWKKGRIFEFMSGARWCQKEYRYRDGYNFQPTARVLAGNGTFVLHVDGMDAGVEVYRLF